jgi:glutamyl-tRNA synthetase
MGQGKMSKRDKGALIEEYQQRHFLPEALVNYLSLLGWNPGDDREKMPIADIIRLFDLPAVNQSNAKFDGKKLANMNMTYLLEQPADRFVTLAKDFFAKQPTGAEVMANEAYFREIMLLAQPKIKSVDELAAYTVYFFTEDFPVEPKVKDKVMAKGDPKARLAELIAALPAMDFATDATVEAGIKALAEGKGLGFGDYQAVARLAVTGTNAGPSITAIFRVLGKDRVLVRVQKFLANP